MPGVSISPVAMMVSISLYHTYGIYVVTVGYELGFGFRVCTLCVAICLGKYPVWYLVLSRVPTPPDSLLYTNNTVYLRQQHQINLV